LVRTEEGNRREEEMTDKILPDKLTDKLSDLIKEIRDTCYRNHDVFRKDAEALDQNDPFQKILSISDRLDSTIFQVLGTQAEVVDLLCVLINRLAISIEKLPDRSEFDVVKEELQAARGVITDAVLPIKQAFEEAKVRDLRGEDAYG
jgi:hypothetical protein